MSEVSAYSFLLCSNGSHFTEQETGVRVLSAAEYIHVSILRAYTKDHREDGWSCWVGCRWNQFRSLTHGICTLDPL